ncbi:MAG: extracellular solute-binding protein [Pseudobutyrivibrio sp.]|nr:extracellular solute-binding protein [Pseudobutyrivibrio sp.]
MKLKRCMAAALAATMAMSMMACGSQEAADQSQAGGTDVNEATEDSTASDEGLSYANITLGEDYTDLNVEISFLNNRTDLDSAEYAGKKWSDYFAEFNQMYPGIKINLTTDTDYSETAKTHLQSGDYETVLMIPSIDKVDLSSYFISYGDLFEMDEQINYASQWSYDGKVYGVPITATTEGIVYNKRVFEEAGVTEIPKTPEEFMAALKAINDYSDDIIPMYTNYAAGWTMGVWDDYIGITGTGDVDYTQQKFLHTAEPFKDYGDDTHAYAVYKILYDAVANGYTEDDYTTTDWEGCKGMINNGQIGCMVLGSWAYPQMCDAGENADDIGYMPFPITVNGKQYAISGPDYTFGINKNASEDEQAAAMVFVKWMTEQSHYSYDQGGLPIAKKDTDTKLSMAGVELMEESPALMGEEDLLNLLNAESELNVRSGGDRKIQELIEHAAIGDMTFDEVMQEWNDKWTAAQESVGVEITNE